MEEEYFSLRYFDNDDLKYSGSEEQEIYEIEDFLRHNEKEEAKKCDIILKSLKACQVKLEEIFKEEHTHRHQQHMAHAFRKTFDLYESEVKCTFSRLFAKNKFIDLIRAKIIDKELKPIREIFENIFEILTGDFTHREKNILLKPWKNDFLLDKSCCLRLRFKTLEIYKELREYAENRLKKLKPSEEKSNEIAATITGEN